MGNTKDIDKAISELYRASAAASTLWLAANGLSQEHGHVIDYQAKAIERGEVALIRPRIGSND